jgi:hypothetical protein
VEKTVCLLKAAIEPRGNYKGVCDLLAAHEHRPQCSYRSVCASHHCFPHVDGSTLQVCKCLCCSAGMGTWPTERWSGKRCCCCTLLGGP